jgi:hypothetical protein
MMYTNFKWSYAPAFLAALYLVAWNVWVGFTLLGDSCGVYWQAPNHLNPVEWVTAFFYFIGLLSVFCAYCFEERRASYLVLTFILFILFMDQIDWGHPILWPSSFAREAETIYSLTLGHLVLLLFEVALYLLTPIWLRRRTGQYFFWLACVPLIVREELASLVNSHTLILDYCFSALPQLNELLTSSALAYFGCLLWMGVPKRTLSV